MRYVYLFHEGNARMKELLGGKGANLAEMTNIGLPVPCGMTITTDACREYYNNGKMLPEGLVEEVTRNLKAIGPFRCGLLHARHDGHHPEPRPQRRHVQGAG